MKGYIVVTESWYRNSEYVRMFSLLEDALTYKNTIGLLLNEIAIIIETELNNNDYNNIIAA